MACAVDVHVQIAAMEIAGLVRVGAGEEQLARAHIRLPAVECNRLATVMQIRSHAFEFFAKCRSLGRIECDIRFGVAHRPGEFDGRRCQRIRIEAGHRSDPEFTRERSQRQVLDTQLCGERTI